MDAEKIAESQTPRNFRLFGLSRDNAVLMTGNGLWGAATGFYMYVLPLFVTSLGANPDQVGLTLAIGSSGSFIGIIAGGLFVNRYSYRTQIWISWILSVVAMAIYVVAPSWIVVALGSLLLSLTFFVVPAMNAYAVAALEGQDPGEAFTIIYAGFSAGAALTPALGGLLIRAFDIRAAFVGALVAGIISTLVMFTLPERGRPETAAEATADDGPVGLIGAIVKPLRTYRIALQNRQFRGLIVLMAVLYVSTLTGVSLLPNYLHDRIGLAPEFVGYFGSGVAVVAIIVSVGLGKVSARIGVYRALAIAQSLLICGMAIELMAPLLGPLAFAFGGVGFAFRGGTQAQNSLARGVIPTVAKGATTGPAFALQSALFFGAQSLGPLLAGLLYVRDPALPLVFAAIVGTAIVVWLVRFGGAGRATGAGA